MTNTRITDPEIFERRYPVILRQYGFRDDSGGAGEHRGGDGVVRRVEFRKPLQVSMLSDRRAFAPFGLNGGEPGARGRNTVRFADGRVVNLGGKNTIALGGGDELCVETPGGGGFGGVTSDPVGGGAD